ncbi:MAG: serine hydrolase domain-containing protein [Desulfobacterales bacterium]|nr:serine hydrolase domain-containing protein [Desulfobacterales bacterium]
MNAHQHLPDRIQHTFQQALAEEVFPGAVMLVQHGTERLWHAAWGVADVTTGEAVHRQTFFDLASLTKPLCTALAILHLVQNGRLALEDRLGERIAAFETSDKADIRIRQLLCHQSGLPAWRPYYETLCQRPPDERGDMLNQLLMHEKLAYRPGESAIYSDLDFLLLQSVIETTSGQSLDRYVDRNVYTPLGLGDLYFTDPAGSLPPNDYAATEKCPWRGRILKGHVHDDNAYALGGVAGHAGLFGTAAGVADLLVTLLAAYRQSGSTGFWDPHLVRHFFQRQAPYDWALGFDTPAATGSSSGKYFSHHSVGHLGFTGTSFWMDLDRGILVVLLTNRIHPSRVNEGIKEFRPLIHDRVMEALGFG